MKVRIPQSYSYGYKLRCNCGDPNCYACIEVINDREINITMDESDSTAVNIFFGLPGNAEIIEWVETEWNDDDELLPAKDMIRIIRIQQNAFETSQRVVKKQRDKIEELSHLIKTLKGTEA